MSTSDHLAASSGVIAEAWDQATVSRTVARLVVLDTAREIVSGSPRASIQLLAQAFQRRTGRDCRARRVRRRLAARLTQLLDAHVSPPGRCHPHPCQGLGGGRLGDPIAPIGRPTAVDADGTCAGSLRHSPYESVALKLDIAPEV